MVCVYARLTLDASTYHYEYIITRAEISTPLANKQKRLLHLESEPACSGWYAQLWWWIPLTQLSHESWDQRTQGTPDASKSIVSLMDVCGSTPHARSHLSYCFYHTGLPITLDTWDREWQPVDRADGLWVVPWSPGSSSKPRGPWQLLFGANVITARFQLSRVDTFVLTAILMSYFSRALPYFSSMVPWFPVP